MSVTTMLRATKKQDEWMTPDYAVKALLPFLPDKSKILCPFDTIESEFFKVLNDNGHSAAASHINGASAIEPGEDFFKYTVRDVRKYDFIISNPPYSQKDAVFEKLFELARPFCMLMGATAGLFEGKRFTMFAEKKRAGIGVIWLSPRVSYIDQSGVAMKSPPFQSAYVCWGMETVRGNHFVRVEK